jgi:hypothetical protein
MSELIASGCSAMKVAAAAAAQEQGVGWQTSAP